ncbi:NAD-dependent methanol dehydrogenase [anaerobic digester metagenome]
MSERAGVLSKFVAPEFVCGGGAHRLVGQYAKNIGSRRVLLVTDPGVTAVGHAASVARALKDTGIDYVVYDEVSENPRVAEVAAGATLFSEEGCNALVAVGGGSPIDCAKGIAVVAATGRPIEEFEGVDRVDRPGPPLLCVPTTAGSSADVSQFAILASPQRRVKFAVISKSIVPDVSLLDPDLLRTLSPELTANTGLDALTHAVEAFVSTGASPVTDLFALSAIRRLATFLPLAVQCPDTPVYREETMLASLEAGLAFSNASLGAVHALAHSLGGLLDIPHGVCNAILLEQVVDCNFNSASDRYRAVAAAFGLEVERASPEVVRAALTNRISSFRRLLGVDQTLASCGMSAGDIPALTKNALLDPCMVTNPRVPNEEMVRRCYERAL